MLETDHGFEVTVADETTVAEDAETGAQTPDRLDGVDCVVRPSRPDDVPVGSAANEEHEENEEREGPSGVAGEEASRVPTIVLCADGHEAARALSAGADRCVTVEDDRTALAAHLASAIRRERRRRTRVRNRCEECAFIASALDTCPTSSSPSVSTVGWSTGTIG